MRFPVSFVATFPLVLGVMLGSAAVTGVRADEAHVLIVAANDGYGVEDCLAEGGDCGKAVADAWCQDRGHGAALSFGRAARNPLAAGEAPYFINCGD